MQKVQPSLTDQEAEVAVLFLEHIVPKVDAKTVMAATEAAKSGRVNQCNIQVKITNCDFQSCFFHQVSSSDVGTIARKAKELSKEVDIEVVGLVADVTRQMGPELTGNELHLMAKMAKNADPDISESDVKILSDIAKMIGPDPSPALVI